METAQLVCNGCRVLLSYPRGAQSVQCSICHSVTQVPVYGHLVCGGCSIMLMYPVGSQSVKCSVCHFVTPCSAANHPNNAAGGSRGGGGSSSALKVVHKPTETVVIENPPTLDEDGAEVANIAVGVKVENS